MSHVKTDNRSLETKLAIRRHMLDRWHADGDIRVFDACQGEGLIWARLRDEYRLSSYWGVDLKPRRGRLKIDSSRILQQPGLRSNVIDCDTYGSPWSLWLSLISQVAEPVTVFLTLGLTTAGPGCGSSMDKLAKDAMGLPRDWPLPRAFSAALHEAAASYCLHTATGYGLTLVEGWSARVNHVATYLAVRVQPCGITTTPSAASSGSGDTAA